MMDKQFYCAFDLGASSGRVMVGQWDGSLLSLFEIHRFPNDAVMAGGVYYWDIFRLFHEMKEGLKKIASEKIPVSGIGIDTWGVDYGYLDKNGNLIGLPIHYRDRRTEGTKEKLGISQDELYSRTGIQFLIFNTIYQLIADTQMRPDVLRKANDLLFIPDLLTYYLTGRKINEYTIASTAQLLNPVTRNWDELLLEKFLPVNTPLDIASKGFFRGMLQPLTMPGTAVGPLCDEVLAETGISRDARLIAVGTHDTASAVAGTPLTKENNMFLSSGTWSLVGMELDKPDYSDLSFQNNVTNEGGVFGTIRYLKNINGLFMVQQLRKHYNSRGMSLGYEDLIREAENAPNKDFIIAPNDPSFLNPENMEEAVHAYCQKTGQGRPAGIGETVRAVYNGLAAEYAAVSNGLAKLRNISVDTLHMVGGGILDKLLCSLTADKTRMRVVAGPTEAAVLGNIITQMIGVGAIENLEKGRDIIRRSFKPVIY